MLNKFSPSSARKTGSLLHKFKYEETLKHIFINYGHLNTDTLTITLCTSELHYFGNAVLSIPKYLLVFY